MPELSRAEQHLAFAGVLTVLFLASLNLTVVGTALPRIIAELEGFHLYAWAFTSFSLASTATLPIFGRLSDIYGRKAILLFGIVVFSLSSVLSGFAQDMPQLIVSRVLQGIGGGALMGMSWAAIADIFTPRERGQYQGFSGAVFGLSSVVGPIVGGLITDSLGWRWVFFVNVPVAVLAFIVIRRYLPKGQRQPDARLDFTGSFLLAGGLIPLLLALTWGGVDYAWTSPLVMTLLAAALVLLMMFAWWQTRARAPILAPELFRDRTFNVANAAGFLTGVGLFGAVIYLPLFIQGVQGGSAAASGFVLTPLMFGMIISSAVSGILVTRTGRYKPFVLGGLVVMLLGFYLASTMGTGTPIWLTVIYMVILGLGIGPTNSLFVLAVQNSLPAALLGTVTSANQFFRQIGGTIGVTLFGTLVTANVQRGLSGTLPPELGDLPPSVTAQLADPNLLTNPDALEQARAVVTGLAGPGAFDAFIASLRAALGSGLSQVFLVSLAVTAVALVITFWLPQQDLRGAEEEAEELGQEGHREESDSGRVVAADD
ncbi:MAG: MDR family MFS transporter [Trueperaceae bacterium]